MLPLKSSCQKGVDHKGRQLLEIHTHAHEYNLTQFAPLLRKATTVDEMLLTVVLAALSSPPAPLAIPPPPSPPLHRLERNTEP